MDAIDIQTKLKRLNRSQKYLSKVFRKSESQISKSINLTEHWDIAEPRFWILRKKIIKHIEKLEARQ